MGTPGTLHEADIQFGNINHEDDRPVKVFEFSPISLEDALSNGHIDLVSRIAATNELLYIIIALSNFSFSGAELRMQTELLADTFRVDETYRYEMLSKGTMLSSTTFNRYVGTCLAKHDGVVTFSRDNKKQTKRPVFTVLDSDVYRAAIIAAKLLYENSFDLSLPEKYITEGHSNFRQQISILNSLQYFGEMTRIEIETLVSDSPDRTPTTSRLILDPLLEAEIVQREDDYVFIEKDKLNPKLFLDRYLLELVGEKANTVLTYTEFREYIDNKAFGDAEIMGELSVDQIRKKIASAILNFKANGRGVFEKDWSCKVDNDSGYASTTRRYKITKKGEDYLKKIRSFFEEPDISLGPASKYCLYDLEEDIVRYQLSSLSNYSELLVFVLKRMFQ